MLPPLFRLIVLRNLAGRSLRNPSQPPPLMAMDQFMVAMLVRARHPAALKGPGQDVEAIFVERREIDRTQL